MGKNIKVIFGILIILVLVNAVASVYFERFDLTQQQRYTLSQPSKDLIKEVKDPIIVDVFLKGDFPSEFKRLQSETRYLLEEFSAYNSEIKFNFINPLEEGVDAQIVANNFYKAGMMPETLNMNQNGKVSESLLFPWAVAYYDDKSVQINLLKKKIGDSNEQIVNTSVENLEYAFADAFSKLIYGKDKKIAIMRGNGELPEKNIVDFVGKLKEYYYIAPFTLDSVTSQPQRTLKQLTEYDLILEAKPTQKYSEEEKLVLDQYLMQGGKMMWLVENTAIEKDSLFTNPDNATLAFPRDLNLNDFFFKYGIRINTSLVKDVISAPIILAQGTGNETQFNPFPWNFSPLAVSNNSHPIIKNTEAVKFDFANSIDTLKNGVKKTILLHSSPTTRLEATPLMVNLEMINQKPDLESYSAGKQNLGVLLEGEFTSVYKNRILPFEVNNYAETSKETKMLVISDGDVIKNEFNREGPVALGYDRFTGTTYGNKEFLMNAINYLLDDTGLLAIRAKNIKLAFLDTKKVAQERTSWQLFNMLLPLIVLGIFAFGFYTVRKKKYIKH
ncbi:gliding motility-associated ABC transporter substrate-binding protein GldG [Mesonia ostreae]|uniref:Gliding motility-associated ABC transporter substrate-binding protein GldG n=1 Tax=Mesonia ostreae TaxID=861110 RepID=A0ABU2KM77_9FLAO|nr:gliding motility-associated ABC transporter substrate-binding protein GldG [Mesonia ostreae]MDT0295813.1 gliding motility-associated ABC transporter substrate-binding protein GldG [Mesonia ostreae]